MLMTYKVINSPHDFTCVQQGIDNIGQWVAGNDLCLNSMKCKVMLITRCRTKAIQMPTLQLYGQPLVNERVNTWELCYQPLFHGHLTLLCGSSSNNCNGTIRWPWLLWMKHTPTQSMENIQVIMAYHSFMHTLTIHSSLYTHGWQNCSQN